MKENVVIKSVPKNHLSPLELAQRWKVSPQTLANRRAARKEPRYFKVGKSVRYSIDVIEEFEASNSVDI